eukprot:gene3457-1350_t
MIWLIFDSEAVIALISAAYRDPLKALYRDLGPWVPAYRNVLEGWRCALRLCRQTSHGLAINMHEADR